MSSTGTHADVGELLFELPGRGRVLFTTRTHGNMSSVGGLDHEHGHDARERLRSELGLRRLVRGYQVHGTTVLLADLRSVGVEDDLPARDSTLAQPPVEADGHATSLAGVGVMVLAADCLPVALGSDRAVAVVHAGWRGLAAGVLEEGVRALRELGGDGNIAAIVGPGAGPCCYEVGPEVHAALGAGGRRPAVDASVAPPPPPPSLVAAGSPIDLATLARERLHAAGVAQVRVLGACTICDHRFYSHRRESTRAGRQAGIAWVA